MHYNCLIVDDEIELAKMTCEYFEMFDVTCTYVATVRECEECLLKNTVDMLLLDINLGNGNGFNLCKKIREQSDIPILFISARQSDDDVLIALNIGGDDYIKKPYTLSVLLAKVKIILKRMVNSEPRKIQEYNRIRVDENVMKVYIEGKEITLKSREFRLFLCLFENRNKIVTKEQLFNQVWGNEFFSDGTLNVHIRRIREKMEEDPNNPKLIKTIWGTGYILEV
ncbi:MAG: two-component system sensor histidine kinase response regulator [Herbinix sp.]|jgi:two-component system response regulator RegX3|nr:two-component system sensor histidine kinase response regulator [Herbinix sp.]